MMDNMGQEKGNRSEKEKMLAGEPYLAFTDELVDERNYAMQLLHQFNNTSPAESGGAASILHRLLPNAGKNLQILPRFHCDYGYNIYCGDNVYFNVNCVVLDVVKVTIGSYTLFGPGVQIYTATHPLDAMLRRTVESANPIVIGEDCWIGGGSIICPGITIGDRCVIGAGSVVTRNVPSDSLAVGNPARVIRVLNQF
ncbi:MAG: sugar O-acetyltransferase [Chitinophagaceae bacterium]